MSEWRDTQLQNLYLGLYDGPHATPKESESGAIFLGIKNISSDCRVNLTNIKYISFDDMPKWTKRVTPVKNDIIFSYEATLHRYAKIPANFIGCLGRRMALIRVDTSKASVNFLLYYFQSPRWRHEVEKNIYTGATVDRIPLTNVPKFNVNLPPLPTQRKIAKILSNYDDLIENNLKRIKLLEESARLTYEEWFLRFRIDGKKLEIDPETKLPFGWEKKSITECDTFKQDKRKVKEFDGEKQYYATADIDGTAITAEGETINWDNKPSRAQIKPDNNTAWFARMSNTYKVLCFNNKNTDLQNNSVLSSGFAGFKAKNDLYLPFLYFTVNSKFFHELKDLYATGATQVSLNNDSMSFIKIIEPSADIVEEFGSKMLPLIEEISILRSQNQLLKEARDILLPRLMTGMIDTDDMDIAI